jgi:hypothetical protein
MEMKTEAAEEETSRLKEVEKKHWTKVSQNHF